jgi:hypothetical protein
VELELRFEEGAEFDDLVVGELAGGCYFVHDLRVLLYF